MGHSGRMSSTALPIISNLTANRVQHLMNQPSSAQKTSLQVRRLFAASRERVFRAWIDREALQQWFRPGGVEVIVSHLEAHVGGSYQFEVKVPNGTRAVTTGKYLEINFP